MLERRSGEDRRKTERLLTEDEIITQLNVLSGELQARHEAQRKTETIVPPGDGRHNGMTHSILTVLARHPEGVIVDEIRNELVGMGVQPNNVDVYLVRLRKRGMIERRGIERKSLYLLAADNARMEHHANP